MTAPSFPQTAGPVLLPGPAGAIELACSLPEADVARAGVAIVAHPHPLQGGTMHNKVVTILERALLELGLATVRFNFRGVGKSEGAHDNGIGETDDLVAIADWLREARPGDTRWLAGFSFGSYVTLRAAPRIHPAQVILVAPPVGRWDFSDIAAPSCPWLIVQGEDDEVVDPKAVFAWAATLQPAPQLVRMPETGHFFHRRLMDLRGAVRNALGGNLPPLRA
jgi:alpha/beta superfamily hydrolase